MIGTVGRKQFMNPKQKATDDPTSSTTPPATTKAQKKNIVNRAAKQNIGTPADKTNNNKQNMPTTDGGKTPHTVARHTRLTNMSLDVYAQLFPNNGLRLGL